MKLFKKLNCIIFCIAALSAAVPFFAIRASVVGEGSVAVVSDTDISSVREKFENANDIKNNYEFSGSQLIKGAEDENHIETRIGNPGSDEFKPDFTISKWDGEVSFKVAPNISDVAKQDKKIKFEDQNILYQTPGTDYLMYDAPDVSADGGYEFAMVLKEKPLGNVLEENIETKGLEFYARPPLNEEIQNSTLTCTATECKDGEGKVIRSRPEDIVDSIAVYASGKTGDFTALGGMNYATGKVAHIKRIKAIDSLGQWIYCKQTIDIEAKKWRVTCDQSFFDSAVYPVTVDPTFGYSTIGGSSDSGDQDLFLSNNFLSSASGRVTNIKIAAWSASTTHVKMAMYNHSGLPTTLVDNSSTGGLTVSRTTKPTQDSEWTSGNCNAAINNSNYYWLAFNADSNSMNIAYDSGNNTRGYSLAYASFPPATASGTMNSYIGPYSIYATYIDPVAATCEWTGNVDTSWSNAGNWTSCNGMSPGTIDAVVIGAASNQPIITTAVGVAELTINSTGALTLNGGSLAVNGSFTLAGGSLNTNSYPISVSGVFTNNNGNFNCGMGTITFTGSGWGINNAAGSLTFSSIRIAQSTVRSVSGDFSITGALTIDSLASFSPNGGTVTFSGGSISNNNGTLNFRGLTLAGEGIFPSHGNFSVIDTFTVNSGAIFVPDAGNVISGAGMLTGFGTVRATRITATPDFSSQYTIANKLLTNLTVEYAGAVAQTINALDYGNLNVKPVGNDITDTFESGTLNVAGNMVIGNGTNTGITATAAANDPTIIVAGDVTVSANSTLINTDSAVKTLDIEGDLTIFGVFTAPGGTNSNSFTLAGDFTNNGVYNHNAGRLVLDGAGDQSLGGTTAVTNFFQFYGIAGNQHNIVYLLPNANGDQTGIPSVYPIGSNHWAAMDDPVGNPDESATYVYDLSSGNELLDLYNLPDQVLSGTITNVQVYARYSGHDGTSAGRVDPTVKTHGTVYRGGYCAAKFNRTWNDCRNGWANNPNTATAWSWNEINALQAGIYEDCSGTYATYATQLYVKVAYDTAAPARNIYFADGNHYAVAANGVFGLAGTASAILSLTRKNTTGHWNLDINNTNTSVSVLYANVSWSDASGGKEIDASGGTNTNGGNNTNWKFFNNTAPAFSSDPLDGGSSVTGPTLVGSNVAFTATASDGENDNYYLAVCKTNSVTANNNAAPTCGGGEWCVATSTASGSPASCNYSAVSGDAESNDWYAFVCDNNASSMCSAVSQGNGDGGSPFAVNHAPTFSSVSNTGGTIGLGESVNFTATSSDSDTNGTADAVAMYVCKSNVFSGGVCAGGEWCHSNLFVTNPNCNYTVQQADATGSHNYYGYIVDSHGFASSSNPRSSTFTTDTTPPIISELTNDATPRKIKTWTWSGEAGDKFRYSVDQNINGVPSGAYGSTITATQSGGNGIYYLHVQAKDISNNESGVTTVFAVLDNIAPVINVIGDNPVSVIRGEAYNDAGAVATDDTDEHVSVRTSGMVNTSVVGSYTVEYGASDIAGNAALPRTRTVTVLSPPSYSGQPSPIKFKIQVPAISKIDYLKQEISRLKKLLAANSVIASPGLCKISVELSYGTQNSSQVKCLQNFLKSQKMLSGPATGNFYNLTKAAVISFQEKYASIILKPYGFVSGNGFVGPKTREVINGMMR